MERRDMGKMGASSRPAPDPMLVVPGLLAVLFAMMALVGVWAAYDRSAAWPRFALIAGGVALAAGIAWAGQRWPVHAAGLAGAGAGLLGAAVAAYFLLVTDWRAITAAKFLPIQRAGLWIQAHRPTLPFTEDINSNVAGGALVILLPLALIGWAYLRRWSRWLAIAYGAVMAFVFVALLLTASRGAWLGLASAGGVVAVLYLLARRTSSLAPAAAVAVTLVILPALLVWLVVTVPASARIAGSVGAGASAIGRASLWQDGLALIGDYPYSGSGLGSTMMAYSSYVLLLHVGYIAHFHNLLLQIAAEQGLPAMSAFSAAVGIAAFLALDRGVGDLRQPGPRLAGWAAAASLIALTVHGLVDAGLYSSRLAPALFLPIGLALAVYRGPAEPGQPIEVAGIPVGLASLALCGVLAGVLGLLPGSRAAFQANLAAVAQTRAELSAYSGPKWPIQDALRRAPAIDLAAAVTRYAAALALDPRNEAANRRLGQIELSRGQYAEARRHLEAAYAVAPWQRATRQLLGEVYAAAGDIGRAAALYHTVDLSQGQIALRLWWYEHLGESDIAARIRKAAE